MFRTCSTQQKQSEDNALRVAERLRIDVRCFRMSEGHRARPIASRLTRRTVVAASMFMPLAARAAAAPIVVASKLDIEGPILGAIIAQVLRGGGLPVEERLALGPTAILRQALLSGAVDLYPEYTGNAAFFFHQDGAPVWKDAKAGYERAKALDAGNGIVWLRPAPADNTWVIAVPNAIAEARGLTSLVDFARWTREGTVKLAASAEFVESAAGLPAFEATYGFKLAAAQLLVLSGGETSATIKAAASGISGVNAAMAYSTDGALLALPMRALVDDCHAQPVYAPSPVVREAVLARYPAIADLLSPVFAGLDLATLRQLNARVAVDGENAEDVARAYLAAKT